MPLNNRFRHQASDGSSHDLVQLQAEKPQTTSSAEYRLRMQRVGECLRRAGVSAIYLIHGTFVGADASGIVREITRLSPKLGRQLRQLHKRAVDRVAHEAGNYTAAFAEAFERSLEVRGGGALPVRLFHWSSENHHIGRADGGVRLLDDIARAECPAGGRLLLWGHSHGGNVLALVSNLLAADEPTLERFFQAAGPYYRWPVWGKVDLPIWSRVEQQLRGSDRPWDRLALDMVTFGTPVRYGWDPGGFAKLLHFVNHRPVPGMPATQARFPPAADDLLHASNGDLMQLIGIAGTNFAPTLWAWRAWLADRKLRRLVQAGIRKRSLVSRLRAGRRTHADGVNLLVDYGPLAGHFGQHLAGHAVYTRREWLLFHAEETARRLYGLGKEGDNVES